MLELAGDEPDAFIVDTDASAGLPTPDVFYNHWIASM